MKNPPDLRRPLPELAELPKFPELADDDWDDDDSDEQPWEQTFQERFLDLLDEADHFMQTIADREDGADDPTWGNFESKISAALEENERLAELDPINYIDNLYKAEQLLRAASGCPVRRYSAKKTGRICLYFTTGAGGRAGINLATDIALPMATIMGQTGELQSVSGQQIVKLGDPANYPADLIEQCYTDAMDTLPLLWPLAADICLLQASLTMLSDPHDTAGDQHRALRALQETADYWRGREMDSIGAVYQRIADQLPTVLQAMATVRMLENGVRTSATTDA